MTRDNAAAYVDLLRNLLLAADALVARFDADPQIRSQSLLEVAADIGRLAPEEDLEAVKALFDGIDGYGRFSELVGLGIASLSKETV